MSRMFSNSKLNGNISNWNVSNVTHMKYMFRKSQFNGDLTKWLSYILLTDEYAFNDCKALKPYQANFDNFNNIKKQIDSYLLYLKLSNKLHIKKHKIYD